MNDTTQEPPDFPADDAAPSDTDLDQTAEEQGPPRDTLPEGVEFLGDRYATLDDYFRSELEEHIAPPIRWILEHLDMRAVRDRFEGDRYSYVHESGSVYRVEQPSA